MCINFCLFTFYAVRYPICITNRLHLYRDVRAPKRVSLEILGMWRTLLLPLLPGPLRSNVVATDRVLSMSQIEHTVCEQMTDVKL